MPICYGLKNATPQKKKKINTKTCDLLTDLKGGQAEAGVKNNNRVL